MPPRNPDTGLGRSAPRPGIWSCGSEKLRAGSVFPSLLERRRRVDQSLFAVIMEAYLHGTSTRKVDDLVKALGADTGISKSEVSRICAELDVGGCGVSGPQPEPVCEGRPPDYRFRTGRP